MWRIALIVAAAACATAPTQQEASVAMDRALLSARGHLEEGRDAEALRLLRAIRAVDPDYPGLEGLPEGLGASRLPVDRSFGARVLWYLPDRLLDLADLVSFDLHAGTGLYLNAHVTRFAQAGLGARNIGGVGWHENRSLGVRKQIELEYAAFFQGAQSVRGWRRGTGTIEAVDEFWSGFNAPGAPVYDTWRDYWSIGGGVTAGVVGFDVALHPLEALDLVLGVLTVDFMDDDIARTRPLALSDDDEDLLQALAEADTWRVGVRPGPAGGEPK